MYSSLVFLSVFSGIFHIHQALEIISPSLQDLDISSSLINLVWLISFESLSHWFAIHSTCFCPSLEPISSHSTLYDQAFALATLLLASFFATLYASLFSSVLSLSRVFLASFFLFKHCCISSFHHHVSFPGLHFPDVFPSNSSPNCPSSLVMVSKLCPPLLHCWILFLGISYSRIIQTKFCSWLHIFNANN